MELGINLFTIRTEIKTPEDFLASAYKLRDMGYSFMQFSGGPYDHEVIKSVSEETAMPIVLTHVPMDRILNDTDALMKEHEYFNCYNIGLGAMPGDVVQDDDLLVKKVTELNEAGKRMKENGFKFFYHHHGMELRKLECGITVMDYMIENAPNINFTVDTYWLQIGGVSVLEYIKKLNGRIECAHLKDYKMCYRPDFHQEISAVGDGNINFKDVVPAIINSGAKYLLVEQDNAPDFDDIWGEVKKSIDYLKTIM